MNRQQIEKAIADAESMVVKLAQDYASSKITPAEFNDQYDSHGSAMIRLRETLAGLPNEPAPIPEPAPARFAVGQQVRIIGPSYAKHTDRIGQETVIIAQKNPTPFYNVKRMGGSPSCVYHASSLAPIAEVPAPKFKRGDVLQKNPNGPRLTVVNIEWDGKIWLYIFGAGGDTLVIAEEYLFPVPPDFVALTEAGYLVCRSSVDPNAIRFIWRLDTGALNYFPTAIEAWRAAATHYLASKK